MKTEDEIVKIIDPVKLLKEIEAFFTFINPPSEKDVKLIRASINYCIDNLPKSQPSGKEPSRVSDACDNWMPDREIFYRQSCAFCGSEYYSLEKIPKFDACSKCDTDGVNKEVIFNFKQSIRLLKKEAECRYANADHKEDRIKAFIDGGNYLKYCIPVTDKMIDKLLNDYESYSGTFISKESIKKYIKQRHNG